MVRLTLRVNKENITIALDRETYTNTIKEMWSITDTYIKVNKDPTKKLTSDIRNVLARWKSKDYITNSTYNSIYCSDGNLPRAYGLLKIHKPGHTFRIIISSIDTSTHALATIYTELSQKTLINSPVTLKIAFS